jgi:hypothetical protein
MNWTTLLSRCVNLCPAGAASHDYTPQIIMIVATQPLVRNTSPEWRYVKMTNEGFAPRTDKRSGLPPKIPPQMRAAILAE